MTTETTPRADPETVRGALLIKMLAGNESSAGVLVSLNREDQKAIRLALAKPEKAQASI